MQPWLFIALVVPAILVVVGVVMLVQYLRYRRPDAGGEDLVRAGRTRDARGRVVKLLDPMPLHTLGRDDVIERAALTPIIEELQPGASRKRGALILTLGAGGFTLLAIAVLLVIEGRPVWNDLASVLGNPAIMAAVVGGVVAPWAAARQERLRRLRRVMLLHRRCPHCGYGLTGVPPQAKDGVTVCPECGCAWSLASGDDGTPSPPPAAPGRMVWLLIATALGAALAGGLVLYMMMR